MGLIVKTDIARILFIELSFLFKGFSWLGMGGSTAIGLLLRF